jgi:hypothetical protein
MIFGVWFVLRQLAVDHPVKILARIIPEKDV